MCSASRANKSKDFVMADMHAPLAWRVDRFFETFRVLHNLNLWELEEAGVITPGAKGGSDWKRFNGDLTTFILKLPAARVEKLFLLVESRLPSTPSQDAETIKALREAAKPFAEYGEILMGQKVRDDSVMLDLFDCKITVSDFRKLFAALAGSAS
jgi:hypothetical protein